MSWKSYKEKKVQTIDLGEIGLDGFFITVRQVKSLTLAETEAARSVSDNEKDKSFDALLDTLSKIILKWNLTDPDNEAIALPLPSVDKTVLRKIPIEVITFVSQKLNEEQKKDIPLESKNSSEPSSQVPTQV